LLAVLDTAFSVFPRHSNEYLYGNLKQAVLPSPTTGRQMKLPYRKEKMYKYMQERSHGSSDIIAHSKLRNDVGVMDVFPFL
jgi:hypothetical protein